MKQPRMTTRDSESSSSDLSSRAPAPPPLDQIRKLLTRIEVWRENEAAGYDACIALLCEAEELLRAAAAPASQLQRYAETVSFAGKPILLPHPDGEWVKYADVAAPADPQGATQMNFCQICGVGIGRGSLCNTCKWAAPVVPVERPPQANTKRCNCGPRECFHPVNLVEGFHCAVQAEAAVVRPHPEKRLVDGLAAELDAAWLVIQRGWDIEPREYFEKEAPKNGFQYPLAQAIHHLWKRELKERPAADSSWLGRPAPLFDIDKLSEDAGEVCFTPKQMDALFAERKSAADRVSALTSKMDQLRKVTETETDDFGNLSVFAQWLLARYAEINALLDPAERPQETP